jgi:hypothetical protein
MSCACCCSTENVKDGVCKVCFDRHKEPGRRKWWEHVNYGEGPPPPKKKDSQPTD